MWSPVYYRRVAMLHLVRKWCRGTRVSRRRVTCVSGLTEVSVRREGASQSPHEAALYVHWPYCLRRCSYCNFNKYINAAVNQAKLRECLQREAHTLLQLSQVSCITSVFFGGGTPSLAPPSTIAAVLETVAKHAHIPCDAEVTLEVNPTPAQTACLGNFMLAGVNRFSIGVQSLNDEDLKVLGRDHTCHDAFHILAEAQRLCPGRVSVDLIFGRPGQSLECWEKELEELLAFCDDHVSLYQLTLERGTQLFRQVQEGILTTPDDEAAAHMYEAARDVLQKHGFLQYEVSNFARNGAVSQHNLNYWMCGQYLGVGPGAHGRFVPHGEGGVLREARTQTLEPDVWMKEVQLWGHGTRRRIMLHQLALLEEVLAMGLRITEGISHQLWSGFSPAVSLQQIVGRSPEVQELQERKLIVLDERGLRCSREGLALLDSLLPLLLLELQAHVNQQESAG